MSKWRKLYILVICILVSSKRYIKAVSHKLTSEQEKFFKNAKFGLVGYKGNRNEI